MLEQLPSATAERRSLGYGLADLPGGGLCLKQRRMCALLPGREGRLGKPCNTICTGTLAYAGRFPLLQLTSDMSK